LKIRLERSLRKLKERTKRVYNNINVSTLSRYLHQRLTEFSKAEES